MLRKFLLVVHPDLIPSTRHPAEHRTNTTNVGMLQAYLREQQYQGSAWLVFYRKPLAVEAELDTVRVVVGRGVDACVRSMASAVGEPAPEAPPESGNRVSSLLGVRRRAPPPPPPPKSLSAYLALSHVERARKRRAWARLAAGTARLADTFGLRAVESRCGWSARPLGQLFLSLETILNEERVNFQGLFALVVCLADKAPVDYAEGVIRISPSRQLKDWRSAILSAASGLDQRAVQGARQRERRREAELVLGCAAGRRVDIERGATVDADAFDDFLGCLLNIESKQPEWRLPIVVRVERDSRPVYDGDCLRVGLHEAPLSIVAAATTVPDDAVRFGHTAKLDLENLAQSCVDALQLKDIELVVAGRPDSLRIPAIASGRGLVLSGAHKIQGASLGDINAALRRLLDLARHPPALLRRLQGASLAIVAPGRAITDNDAGVLLLPADFVYA